jgi:hypothetical protein
MELQLAPAKLSLAIMLHQGITTLNPVLALSMVSVVSPAQMILRRFALVESVTILLIGEPAPYPSKALLPSRVTWRVLICLDQSKQSPDTHVMGICSQRVMWLTVPMLLQGTIILDLHRKV